MQIKVCRNDEELGREAALEAAKIINEAIGHKGRARIVMATGNSQLHTISELLKTEVDWSKVAMFHLDEYIGLPESHPASFRKYLKEKFIDKVTLFSASLVSGEGNLAENIRNLNEEITQEEIDLGLIGIGENAHIAFNDPPADFDTKEPYIIVNLDEGCMKQQVGEGWFNSIDEVPKQAISMSVFQIMQCNNIISCVPYKVKANAVSMTLKSELTNTVPATILKSHKSIMLFLDQDSASLITNNEL